MILKLAAEDFSNSFGLSLYDNNNLYNEINLKSIDLSVDVLNKLKKWYKSYYIYTGMNETELEKYKNCGSVDNPCPAICGYMSCDYKCGDKLLNSKYFAVCS